MFGVQRSFPRSVAAVHTPGLDDPRPSNGPTALWKDKSPLYCGFLESVEPNTSALCWLVYDSHEDDGLPDDNALWVGERDFFHVPSVAMCGV